MSERLAGGRRETAPAHLVGRLLGRGRKPIRSGMGSAQCPCPSSSAGTSRILATDIDSGRDRQGGGAASIRKTSWSASAANAPRPFQKAWWDGGSGVPQAAHDTGVVQAAQPDRRLVADERAVRRHSSARNVAIYFDAKPTQGGRLRPFLASSLALKASSIIGHSENLGSGGEGRALWARPSINPSG